MPNPPKQPNSVEDIYASTEPAKSRPTSVPKAVRSNPRPAVPYQANLIAPMGQSAKPSKLLYLIIIGIVLIIVIGGVAGLAWWRSQSKSETVDVNQAVNQNVNQAVVNQNLNNSKPVAQNQNTTPVVVPVINEPVDVPADADRDGLSDEEEARLGTDPNVVDTDSDGLSDLLEVRIYKSNPLNVDSDNNGTSDGDEVKAGDNPAGSGQLFDISNKTLN